MGVDQEMETIMKKDQAMSKPSKKSLLLIIKRLYEALITSEAVEMADEEVEKVLKSYNLHKF